MYQVYFIESTEDIPLSMFAGTAWLFVRVPSTACRRDYNTLGREDCTLVFRRGWPSLFQGAAKRKSSIEECVQSKQTSCADPLECAWAQALAGVRADFLLISGISALSCTRSLRNRHRIPAIHCVDAEL